MAGFDPNGPAIPAPAGAVQDLDNPPNGNKAVIAVYSVCIVITAVAVITRLYAKFFFLKSPRVVDYLLLPTYGVYIAHCVFWLRMNSTTGNFVHMWNFRISGLAPFYRNGFYGTLFYEAVMMAIKPLILVEWSTIFAASNTREWFKWICYVVATVNFLMYFIAIMIDATSCSPRAYWWDRSIPGGHCVNTRNMPIATGVMNAVIDFIILLLPQGIIWRLRMDKNKRIGVSLVFFVGAISVAAAIARTALSFIYSESMDVTFNFSKAGIFILIEMTAAILVFTIPTAPKPLTYLAKQAGSSVSRLIGSRGSGSGSDGPYATGSARPGQENYHDVERRGETLPIPKLRPAKKQRLSSSSTHDDEDWELESGVLGPSSSK